MAWVFAACIRDVLLLFFCYVQGGFFVTVLLIFAKRNIYQAFFLSSNISVVKEFGAFHSCTDQQA